MSNRAWISIVIILAIIIAVLVWFLFATPISKPATQSATSTPMTTTTTTTTSTSTAPLDTEVTVSSPKPGATVSHTITVTGQAPGAWFFEAQFPLLVKDSNNETVASEPAHAQGDWESTGEVTFTDSIVVDPSFHGPATLVLLRDNPSGLPENDDSVTVPIVIQ